MDKALIIDGKTYISAKNATQLVGYTSDYIGQLCRANKIPAKLVGRSWYVSEQDLIRHKNSKGAQFVKSSRNRSKKHHSINDRSQNFYANNEIGDLKESPINLNSNTESSVHEFSQDNVVYEQNVVKPRLYGIPSRLGEKVITPLSYEKEEKELFPVLRREVFLSSIDFDRAKKRYDSLHSLPDRYIKSGLFASTIVIVAIFIFNLGFLLNAGSSHIKHLFPNAYKEVSMLSSGKFSVVPNLNIEKIDISEIKNLNIAAAGISYNQFESAFSWFKNIGVKIVKPWIQSEPQINVVVVKNENVLEGEKNKLPSSVESSKVDIVPSQANQSKIIFVPSTNQEYIDSKISERFDDFKTSFLLSSITPNVNRFYVTRQNDAIINSINNSAGSSSQGSGGASSLSDLSDLSLGALNYGDLLMYDGSNWVNVATSSLGISGSGTVTSVTAGAGLSGGVISTTGTISLDIANANTWTAKQNFFGAASSTLISGNQAWFGSTATTTITNSGWIGQGTSTPFAQLSVNSEAGNAALVVGSSTATSLIVDKNGNVGIGTASPTRLLDVNGIVNAKEYYLWDQRVLAGTANQLILNYTGSYTSVGINTLGVERLKIDTDGKVGIGTSTPQYLLNLATTTRAQLSLTGNISDSPWTFRSIGSNLYISTSSPTTFSTTSISALEIAGGGFGTTTVRGLNISGQATSTSNVGFNITSGCYAVNGSCISGGVGSGASSTLLADFNTFSNTNNFTGKLGLASSSPWAKLSVNSIAGEPAFVIGSSTKTDFIVDSFGRVGIGTTTPNAELTVVGRISNLISTSTQFSIASTTILSSPPYDLFIQGNLAVTANGEISIYDISNPNEPMFIGSTSGGNSFDSVVVSGRYAYATDAGSSYGFAVIDISNASSPRVISSFFPSSLPAKMLVSGKTVYVVDENNGLISAVDISNPLSPTLVSSVLIGSTPAKAHLFDKYLFVEDPSASNIYVIDVHDPSSMYEVGSFGDGGAATISGNYLYQVGTNSVAVYDISDPTSVLFAGSLNLNNTPTYITSSGNQIYYSVNNNVGIANISDPIHPYEMKRITNLGITGLAGLKISGRNIFIQDDSLNAFHIVNIPGTETSSLYASSAEFGNTKISSSLDVLGGVNIRQFINVGYGGIVSQGGLSVSATSSPSYFGGKVGIGTTTPRFSLTIATSTAPQLSLSAGAGFGQWTFRNAGGSLYISTTTVAGTATTSIAALEIAGGGFGTTTVRGLNISGQATSTSNVGFNITGGCYAISGTCISGGSGSGASSTLLADFNTFSNTNNFTGKLGLASSTPWGQLSINPNALGSGVPEFVIGSSTATHFIVNGGGNVGIGNTNPSSKLTITTTSLQDGILVTTSGTNQPSVILEDTSNSKKAGFRLAGGSSGTFQFGGGYGGTSIDSMQFGTDVIASGVNANLDITTSRFNFANGYLGVASTSPWAQLSIHRNTSDTSNAPLFSIASSTASATTSVLTVLNNGYVGIGSDFPRSALDVVASHSSDAMNVQSSNANGISSIAFWNENGGNRAARIGYFNSNSIGDERLNNVVFSANGANMIFFDDNLSQTRIYINNSNGGIGFATTTPYFGLTIATTTKPQLSLSAGAGLGQWTFRNAGGNLYISTTTVQGLSTTSISALEISGDGFGTTTVRGLNISGLATSTSNVGFNITSGCYAIGGNCISGGVGSGASSTLLADFNTFSNTNNFTTYLAVGTSTPRYALTVSSTTAPQLALSAGVGLAQWVQRNAGGNFYISTTTIDGTSTTSISALEISGSGFGTTTVRGLNISGQATSTSNVGFNITSGCYAIGGTCLQGGSGLTSYDAWTHPSYGGSATSSLITLTNGFLSTASSTIVGNSTTTGDFSAGSVLTVRNGGNIGVATTTPLEKFSVVGNGYFTGNLGINVRPTAAFQVADGSYSFKLSNASGLQNYTTGTTGWANFGTNGTLPVTTYYDSSNNEIGRITPSGTVVVDPASGNGIELHIANSSPYNLRMFNDTYSAVTPSISFTVDNAGAALFGTDGNTSLSVYTNGYTNPRMVFAGSGDITAQATTSVQYSNGLTTYGAPTYSGQGLNIINSSNAINRPFGVQFGGWAGYTHSGIYGVMTNTAGNTVGDIAFATRNATSDATFTERMRILNTGKIGIASTSPFARLSIESQAGEMAFVVGSSTATTFIIDNLGKVGIGTTSPQASLAVQAKGAEVPFLVSSSAGAPLASLSTAGALTLKAGAAAECVYGPGTINCNSSTLAVQINTGAKMTFGTAVTTVNQTLQSNTGSSVFQSTGNIGAGTTTPAYILTAHSASAPQLALSAGAGITQWTARNAGGNFYLSTTTVDGTATTSISALEIAGDGFGTTTLRGLNISGRATTTSNVGFNISTGCYAINNVCVSGGGSGTVNSGTFGQLAFYGANGTALSGTSTISVSTTTAEGRVGIATTTGFNATLTLQGAASLDILRVASSSGRSVFVLSEWGGLTQNISSSTAVSIQDGSGNSVFAVDTTQTTGAGVDITAASGQTSNLFNIYASNGSTNYLAVGSSGNFGIGTGTPSHMFTIATSTTTKEPVFDIYSNNSGATSTVGFFVSTTTGSTAGVGLALPSALRNYVLVGNGKVQAGMAIVNGGLCVDNDGWCTASTTGRISSVTTTAGGTDLAEIYLSTDTLEPGDVIAISTPINHIKIANPFEDKNKALGVIATDPGIILGLKPGEEQKGNQYPVALAGRVPVKVSTENGNIVAGDYLTLSNTPGVAMRATESGNVIGRALEDYSGSTVSKITMFVDNTYYAGDATVIMVNGTTTTIYMNGSDENATSTNPVDGQATTTATSTSGLTTEEGLGQIIVKFLEEIGVKIMNGIAYIKTLFVENLTVGTKEKPSGITIYDEATGEPYCLKVVNGAMVSVAGECMGNDSNNTNDVINENYDENNQENNNATSTGELISETSSTTDPIIEEMASSTTPLSEEGSQQITGDQSSSSSGTTSGDGVNSDMVNEVVVEEVVLNPEDSPVSSSESNSENPSSDITTE